MNPFNVFANHPPNPQVTELLPGGDLQRYVASSGPLDEKTLAVVALEVLTTIKGCHDLGVLHGEGSIVAWESWKAALYRCVCGEENQYRMNEGRSVGLLLVR